MDLEVARTTVEALEAELVVAEADLGAARAALEGVQAEAARGRVQLVPQPAVTAQDLAIIGALRDLVAQAGVPIQDLLQQASAAVAATRAAAAGGAGQAAASA